MSIRTVSYIVAAAVFVAFGFRRPTPNSLRSRSLRNRCVSMFSTAAKSPRPTSMPTA